jgi:outer membrane protein assembly factor BamD (BamD/ComL family)
MVNGEWLKTGFIHSSLTFDGFYSLRGVKMKKYMLMLCAVVLTAVCAASSARAQTGAVARGPDPSVVKDNDAEKSATHELEVARHYFKMKKAYFAAFKRSNELIAGYPEFTRLDEVLYIAGMSGLYLSEGKGKQAPPKGTPENAREFSPESLRTEARVYLSRLVEEFPESKFRKDAEEALRTLGGVAKKAVSEQ